MVKLLIISALLQVQLMVVLSRPVLKGSSICPKYYNFFGYELSHLGCCIDHLHCSVPIDLTSNRIARDLQKIESPRRKKRAERKKRDVGLVYGRNYSLCRSTVSVITPIYATSASTNTLVQLLQVPPVLTQPIVVHTCEEKETPIVRGHCKQHFKRESVYVVIDGSSSLGDVSFQKDYILVEAGCDISLQVELDESHFLGNLNGYKAGIGSPGGLNPIGAYNSSVYGRPVSNYKDPGSLNLSKPVSNNNSGNYYEESSSKAAEPYAGSKQPVYYPSNVSEAYGNGDGSPYATVKEPVYENPAPDTYAHPEPGQNAGEYEYPSEPMSPQHSSVAPYPVYVNPEPYISATPVPNENSNSYAGRPYAYEGASAPGNHPPEHYGYVANASASQDSYNKPAPNNTYVEHGYPKPGAYKQSNPLEYPTAPSGSSLPAGYYEPPNYSSLGNDTVETYYKPAVNAPGVPPILSYVSEQPYPSPPVTPEPYIANVPSRTPVDPNYPVYSPYVSEQPYPSPPVSPEPYIENVPSRTPLVPNYPVYSPYVSEQPYPSPPVSPEPYIENMPSGTPVDPNYPVYSPYGYQSGGVHGNHSVPGAPHYGPYPDYVLPNGSHLHPVYHQPYPNVSNPIYLPPGNVPYPLSGPYENLSYPAGPHGSVSHPEYLPSGYVSYPPSGPHGNATYSAYGPPANVSHPSYGTRGNVSYSVTGMSMSISRPVPGAPLDEGYSEYGYAGHLSRPVDGNYGNTSYLEYGQPGNVSYPVYAPPGNVSYPVYAPPGNVSYPVYAPPGNVSYPVYAPPGNVSYPVYAPPGKSSYPVHETLGKESYPLYGPPGNVSYPTDEYPVHEPLGNESYPLYGPPGNVSYPTNESHGTPVYGPAGHASYPLYGSPGNSSYPLDGHPGNLSYPIYGPHGYLGYPVYGHPGNSSYPHYGPPGHASYPLYGLPGNSSNPVYGYHGPVGYPLYGPPGNGSYPSYPCPNVTHPFYGPPHLPYFPPGNVSSPGYAYPPYVFYPGYAPHNVSYHLYPTIQNASYSAYTPPANASSVVAPYGYYPAYAPHNVSYNLYPTVQNASYSAYVPPTNASSLVAPYGYYAVYSPGNNNTGTYTTNSTYSYENNTAPSHPAYPSYASSNQPEPPKTYSEPVPSPSYNQSHYPTPEELIYNPGLQEPGYSGQQGQYPGGNGRPPPGFQPYYGPKLGGRDDTGYIRAPRYSIPDRSPVHSGIPYPGPPPGMYVKPHEIGLPLYSVTGNQDRIRGYMRQS